MKNIYIENIDSQTNEITIKFNSDLFNTLHKSMRTLFYNGNETYILNDGCINKFFYIIVNLFMYSVLCYNGQSSNPILFYSDFPLSYTLKGKSYKMNTTKYKTSTHTLEKLGYIKRNIVVKGYNGATGPTKISYELTELTKNLFSSEALTQKYETLSFKFNEKLMEIVKQNIISMYQNSLISPMYEFYCNKAYGQPAPSTEELNKLFNEATIAYNAYTAAMNKFFSAISTKLKTMN